MNHAVPSGIADPQRIAALVRTGLLDTAADESFDRLARLAAELLGAPIALVTLVDRDRQFFKSCIGVGGALAAERQTPLSHSFCRHTVETGAPLVVDDARAHPLVAGNPAIEEFGIVAYAGVPLVDDGGQVLGSFCVADTRPRHWTPEQLEVLGTLAASVLTEIRLRMAVQVARERGAEEERVRQQMEELVQGLDVIVWEMDIPSFRFTFVSRRAEEMLGYPIARWTEEPSFWQDVVLHPEDREWALDFCQTATRDGRDHTLEYRTRRADGETMWIRDMVRVTRDESGGTRQVRGVMIDITAEKLAAQQLAKREAQLAEAQSVAHIGSWEWEVTSNTITWSDEQFRLHGREPRPSVNFDWFMSHIHPDDRSWMEERLNRSLQQGEAFSFPYRIVRADGEVRWLSATGSVSRGSDGTPLRMFGTSQDITERRATEGALRTSEARFRDMFEQFPVSVQIFDPTGRTVRVNPKYTELWGLTLDDLGGFNPLTDAQLEPIRDLMRRGFAGETVSLPPLPFDTSQVRPRSGGDTRRWIEAYLFPVRETTGAVREVILVHDDVTDRVEAEAALRASEQSYRTIFENTSEGIWVHDLETGAMLDVNRAACEMMGYTYEEMMAAGHDALLVPGSQYTAERVAEYMALAAAGEVPRFEWMGRHKDGRVVWSDITLRRVAINGQDRVLACARDITAARAAEEARREAERDAQRTASRMRAVAGAAAGVIGARTVDDLQTVLREECRGVIAFDAFTMALYDPDAHTLTHLEGYDADLWIPRATISAAGTPAERVIRERRPLLTLRADHPEAAGAKLMGTGRRSESVIRVPIVGGERVLGLLSAQSYTPDLYSAQDVEVLEAVAALAATALLNLELLGEREAAEEALLHANEALERRVAERTEELQQRGEEMEGVFRALPDLFFRLSPEATVLPHRSELDARLYQAPPQFVGRALSDMLAAVMENEEDSARIREAVRRIQRTGEVVSVEYRLATDGEPREYEARLVKLEDGSLIAVARDITERKQFEGALTKREEHFRRLIENAHDLVVVVDDANTVRYVSPSVERILGYTPDEWIGQPGSMITHPDDLEMGLGRLAEAVARPGTTVTAEFRVRHRDGGWRVMEIYSRTLDPTSTADGIVVNARDITERKQFEEALRRSEDRFRRLIENAHDVVYIIDAEGRVLYVSPSVERVLGYPPEELLGRTGAINTHPDDLEAGWKKMVEVVERPGTTVPGEFRVRHRDGSWRVIETYSRTLSLDSADEGIVVNARDVTERVEAEQALKQSEEHFRSLIENAHDTVFVVDAEGRFLYISPSMERVLGHRPEELLGTSAALLTHPDDHEEGWGRMAALLERPGTGISGEFRHRHKDGSWRIIETYARTLSPDSAAQGIVVNARDITERKQFEEALQERETRFRRLTENSSDLVQIIYPDTRMGYTGPSVVHLLGYTPEEIAGLSNLDFVHPDDRESVAETIHAIFAAPGTSRSVRYRVRHKDGRWRVFEAFGRTLLPDSADEGLVCNARDITERHEAEEAVRRSEEHFRRLTENAHDLVVVSRTDGSVEYISPSVERILGYTQEEALRMGVDDWVHPDDVATIASEYARFKSEPSYVNRTQMRARHKDGSWRIIESLARSFSPDTTEHGIVINARDVTERVEAERALQEREEWFRGLTENAYDMVQVIDTEGRLLYVTPSVERILGYRPDELIEVAGAMPLHPDDLPTAAAKFVEVMSRPGSAVPGTFRTRHKDGSWRVIETYARTLSPTSPDQGIVVNARDITERVAAEQALQQSEEHFRRLIENAHDLVHVLDTAGNTLYISPSAERILGYKPEELVGGLAMDLVHPEDRAAGEATLGRLIAGSTSGASGEFRLRHKDGSYRFVESFGRFVSPDVPERGIVINARDVTERKHFEEALRDSEEHFRRLIENAYDMVLVMDTTGAITYASPSAQRVLGHAPEALVGVSGFSLLHPDDVDLATERTGETVGTPGAVFASELRLRHHDGSYRILETFCRTLADDSPDEGIVVNARDVTERKHFEQALRDSEEHFRRLIENSSDVISIVDADGTVRFQSDAVRRLFGWDPADGVGTSWERVHPDDIATVQQAFAQLFERPEETQTARFRFLGATGAYHPVEAVAKVIGDPPQGAVISMRDISERLEAEEALRDSEARYRSLIENAHDIVTILDLDGRIMYQSPQVERVLGYDPLELLGQNALDLVHPEDVAAPAEALGQILTSSGATVTTEYRFRHKDGSWRYLETFGRSLVPDAPEQGLVFNTRDVTERREAQRLLQEREEHFRKLIETSHDLIQTLDSQGNIVYTGPSVERLLGYTPEEITGKGASDFIHPDDHAAVAERIREALTNPGTIIHLEYRVLHKDGRWRWFEAIGRTLSPDTAEHGMVANARDITERHRAEEELKRQRTYFELLLASVEAGISAWDPQCRFEYVSTNAVPDPVAREFIIGKTHAEYYAWCGKPQEVAAQRHAFVEEAIRTRRATEFEDPVTLPDGTPGHMLRRYWPVFDARGQVERVIGYSVDITERTRAEEALRHATEEAERAREAAERANRAKSEFLSRMSHELRTPMNSILGFAQLLDRAPLPPENRKGVGHILKAGRHLLQLINEVLEIARIEAGRHSLSLEPVRLGTVLQEAVALVRPLAAQWRVELDEGPWPCCAAYVQADRQRVTQVLLNLLGNAIKYNRPGGRVRVTCETVEGERPRLAVRVEDTGRGIPADREDQLFTPFARLGAEQSQVEGTGLGLALSQRLTEAMGGTLTLESSGAEGSVFRLELQITADPLQQFEDAGSAPVAADEVAHAPATLLYIEDNLANLSLVETILLSRPEWRTMPALQGLIGLELAREHLPDLVLLDLHLPDIHGEEVLRRLRSEPRTAAIPVVVITADATRTTTERLRAAGADAYLTKPLDVDEFLETVERFLPSPEPKP